MAEEVCSHIPCILTYGGHARDIALNYAALAVTLAAAAYALYAHVRAAAPAERRARVAWNAAALAGVCAFQVGLCLALGCSGISIVWNAVVGAAVMQQLALRAPAPREAGAAAPPARMPQPSPALLVALTALGAAGLDVYYAITAPALTTMAHAGAVALGALLVGAELCTLRPAAWVAGRARGGPLLDSS